jgi:hypothetical protein
LKIKKDYQSRNIGWFMTIEFGISVELSLS